jgi:hypothetical protein
MSTRTLILTAVASAALAVPVSQAGATNALVLKEAHLGLAATTLGTDAGQKQKGHKRHKGGIRPLVASTPTVTSPAVHSSGGSPDPSLIAQANPGTPVPIAPDQGDGDPYLQTPQD